MHLRYGSIIIPLLLAGLLTPAGVCGQARPKPPKLTILVPAYFYPSGDGLKHWNTMIESAATVPIIAIANPATGPGEKMDENYTAVIGRAVKAGVKVVGYVSTRYGTRTQADAEKDMERWAQLYPEVQGFFFDEQASEINQIGYYAALYAKAKAVRKDGLVISNPGTTCAEAYFGRPTADLICIFENVKGFSSLRLPAWSSSYPAGRFAALNWDVKGTSTMRSYVRSAESHHLGCIYVTDNATKANPWYRLPTYWAEEVDAVKYVNSR